MSGFEPETYSFAYTSFYKMLIRGLDCILSLFLLKLSSPCQSFGRFCATVLTMHWPLTVIRDSLLNFLDSGQESCDPPWSCSTSWATSAYSLIKLSIKSSSSSLMASEPRRPNPPFAKEEIIPSYPSGYASFTIFSLFWKALRTGSSKFESSAAKAFFKSAGWRLLATKSFSSSS